MSGGTLRSIRQRKAEREKHDRKVIADCQRQEELKVNREAIIAEVCSTFGWAELDDFAQEMIDKAVSGQVVDLKKLKADLAAWKESKEN